MNHRICLWEPDHRSGLGNWLQLMTPHPGPGPAPDNAQAENHSSAVIKLGSIWNYPVPAIILITMITCHNDNPPHLAAIGARAVDPVRDVKLRHRGELRQHRPGLGDGGRRQARELLGGGELGELRPLRVGALAGHRVLQQHLLDGLPHLQQGKWSQLIRDRAIREKSNHQPD